MIAFEPRAGLTLYGADGRSIVLDREIAKGGEGSVWGIADKPDFVAKFYHQGLSPEQARKLGAMCRLKSEHLVKIAAWPVDLVRPTAAGVPQGFLMRRINGYSQAHLLYTPKSRRTHFPEAQLPFLLHTSVNIARAFATVHDAGQVIGDVNHGNLLVSKDAVVALIDCDSFEIIDGALRFPCPVGVPTYTPPELQGKSFSGVQRTQQHDTFGLAVLVFHMLFLGRHPFSGIFRQGQGDKTIEDAIREFRFAYSPNRGATEMDQPSWVPPLSIYPPEIANLFLRAFSAQGASGSRPSSHEWIPALEGLSHNLRRCPANESHFYFQSLASCPWCTAERATGIPMFGFTLTVIGMQGFDIVALWAQIEAVRPDESGKPIYPNDITSQFQPDPRIQETRARRRKKRILSAGSILLAILIVSPGLLPPAISIAVLIGGLVAMTTLWKQGHPGEKFAREHAIALRSYEAAYSRWDSSQPHPEAFVRTMKRLQTHRHELQELPSVRAARMVKLQAELRGKQLQRFLERFKIDKEKIAGIGQGRKNLLQAYGIEDASDVRFDIAIKGFGPALKAALWAWRLSKEQLFVFNSAEGIDPADIRALDLELAQKKAALVHALSSGPAALRQILLPWQVERSRALANLNHWSRAVAQAEVNTKELARW
jgi:DNA-binding helix-hairpin-helix protein with protein kinase domain